LASDDILDKSGRSATALTKICDAILCFPDSMIELVVLHPLKTRFEWTQIPSGVKKLAEMRFHGCTEDNAYKIYGVAESRGALVIVRPDGVVGMVDHLEAYDEVRCFFSRCLVLKA
jgi:phenol 2-monooxygenase